MEESPAGSDAEPEEDVVFQGRVTAEDSPAHSASEAEENVVPHGTEVKEWCSDPASALLPGWDKGLKYACPRCKLELVDWRAVQYHLVRSARCRAAIHEKSKAAIMRRFRDAAVQGSVAPAQLESMKDSPKSLLLPVKALDKPAMAEKCAKTTQKSIGRVIFGVDGSFWGLVVAEDRRNWRLDSGRSARKAGEGRQWKWAADDQAGMDGTPFSTSVVSPTFSQASPLSLGSSPCPSSMEPSSFMLPSPAYPDTDLPLLEDVQRTVSSGVLQPGVGHEIVSADGVSWGRVTAEERTCWRLSDGRIARKSTEGKKWRWAAESGASLGKGFADIPDESAPQVDTSCSTDVGEAVVNGLELAGAVHLLEEISSWLPLRAAVNALWVCKDWAEILKGFLPLTLPPPQADKFLEFCLLEVLVKFDDARLPVPISAIYSEMRFAARRALANSHARAHLEEIASHMQGPACKKQQEEFLREGRPHHVAWVADVKSSGFRSLERLAKHFSSGKESLIEIFHQRWHKRIHHSPNTRTCTEWLMTNVNRKHPLFIAHENFLQCAKD